MKIRIILFLASLIGLATPVQADEFANYSFVVCNTCSSAAQFEFAARSGHLGKVLVMNLDTRSARAFRVEFNADGWNEMETVTPISVPPKVYDEIERYHALKDALQSINSQLNSSATGYQPLRHWGNNSSLSSVSGPFGGICGPADNPDIATLIPDGIFQKACQAHDNCYASGTNLASKSFCDAAFRADLDEAIKRHVENFQKLTKFLETLALANAAEVYFDFVVETEIAFDAYCDTPANASKPFCIVGFEDADAARELGGAGGELLYQALGNYDSEAYDIELSYRCFNYSISVNGGQAFVSTQCYLAPR